MNKWTIGKRIIFAIGTLCLLLALTGGIVWQSLHGINRSSVSLKTDIMPGVIQSSKMGALLAKDNNLLQKFVVSSGAPRDAIKKAMGDITVQFDATMKEYGATTYEDEDKALFAKVISAGEAYRSAKEQYIKLIETDGAVEDIMKMSDQKVSPGYDAYVAATEALFTYNARNGDRISAAISDQASSTSITTLSVSVAALVFGVVVGFYIIRSINKALGEISTHLTDGAAQTTASSTEVSTTSQSLAEGASEQAASLEETSASLEEITSMTKRNAESATQAKTLASETRAAAEEGSANMGTMKQAMDAIKDSSTNIAKIVKTIDEIAFQTNILALNAAVEAARAGEAGAGFAVVAEEVRSLAQRSATAAKETATLIEESVTRSGHGVEISGKVAQSFVAIVEKARSVDSLVGEIATASNEQSQGIGQVTTAVSQMDKVTQQNAASAEQSAAAAEELNAQSHLLHETVRQLETLVGTAGKRAVEVEHKKPEPAAGKPITPKLPKRASASQRQIAPPAGAKKAGDDFWK
jgi:methyl-accepting chemotaxis protein